MSHGVIGLAVLLPLLFYGYPIQAQSQPVPPFRIGINFPFRNPEAASLVTYLRLVHEGGASAMRQMTFADVHWVQVEPQNDTWNFVRADSAINNAYGIHSVPTLYHISAGGNDQTGLQVPWRACSNPGCGWDAARDSSDSKDYVQTVVHRYQSHVKYWEIANEMSSKMKPPTGLPLPDFIDFMQKNYRWIEEADSEAQVLISGLLGTYGLPMELPRNWLRQFLAGGGVGSFDILSYHDYHSWWTLPMHYDSLKAVLTEFGLGSMPLWCTESSISSDPTTSITPDYASIDEQAADVWRRSAVLFAKGLQVYFWHSSWSSGGNSAWREFGIIDAHGTKKKAFHAYKLLTEKIEGFGTATPLSFGRVTDDNTSGGEGVWVVRFEWPDGTLRWVAWSPDNQSFSLTNLKGDQLTLTLVVPSTISADGETATFDTRPLTVTNGSAQLALTVTPVLVEENNITAVQGEMRVPTSFALEQNYPNPFNPQTNITFALPERVKVRLDVFNVLGQKVMTLVNGTLEQGQYNISFDGSHLASGIYIYRLKAGSFTANREMILLK